jgi:hypothetical protein
VGESFSPTQHGQKFWFSNTFAHSLLSTHATEVLFFAGSNPVLHLQDRHTFYSSELSAESRVIYTQERLRAKYVAIQWQLSCGASSFFSSSGPAYLLKKENGEVQRAVWPFKCAKEHI